MINLHSTIWGTVQNGEMTRKCRAPITGSKGKSRKSRRKNQLDFTGPKGKNRKSSRKTQLDFTGAKGKNRKSSRNLCRAYHRVATVRRRIVSATRRGSSWKEHRPSGLNFACDICDRSIAVAAMRLRN